MKRYFTKALVLMFGLAVVASFTACHSGGDDGAAPEQTTVVTPKHSIKGTILDAAGKPLSGASVTINGQAETVTGNEFIRTGLSDGTYVVTVTRTDYKSAEETVTLAVQTVENEMVGQNVEKVFYLTKNEETGEMQLQIGEAQTGDEITIETVEHAYDDGTQANEVDVNETTTDGKINVQAETPVISNEAYTDIDEQIKDQSNGEEDITDFKITLTNITSLEDAKAVARANRVASSRATRATTALPNNQELLAGVAVNAGPFMIAFPGGMTFDVTITLPEDVKTAVKDNIYYTIDGSSWLSLNDAAAAELGIKEIDKSQDGKIVIKMGIVRTISYAFGVRVLEARQATSYEMLTDIAPVTNNTASNRTITTMPYNVKAGVVLVNETHNALTDFLRKLVLRKYGTLAVKTAKTVTKAYRFDPAYTMHPYGVLYLQGYQEVTNVTYSIEGGDARFSATEYGDALVFPYEVWTEVTPTHSGGSY